MMGSLQIFSSNRFFILWTESILKFLSFFMMQHIRYKWWPRKLSCIHDSFDIFWYVMYVTCSCRKIKGINKMITKKNNLIFQHTLVWNERRSIQWQIQTFRWGGGGEGEGVCGHPDPEIGGWSQNHFFLASVWSKIKGGRALPMDSPLQSVWRFCMWIFKWLN